MPTGMNGKPKNVASRTNSSPLPHFRDYIFIFLIAIVCVSAITVLYVFEGPKLVPSGGDLKLYYLVLILWALLPALILFIGTKSYARVKYVHLGLSVELGGSAAMFFIVLFLGFKLTAAPETFDLIVRAHSTDNPMFTSGSMTLDIPGQPQKDIGPDGEANFKGLTSTLKGTTVRILPHLNGYEHNWISIKLEGNVVDLNLVKENPITVLTGSLIPIPNANQKIRILVDGQDGETSSDDLGRFKLNVAGKVGDRVRLKIFRGTNLVFDDFELLPGPVAVRLRTTR